MTAPAVLAAELDDVIAAQVGRRVARAKVTTVRPSGNGRAAEVQAEALNRDLRQRDRAVDADVDAEVRRVDDHVRIEVDADAVVADARFVDQRLAEDVRLVDRQDLAVAAARVAEVSNT